MMYPKRSVIFKLNFLIDFTYDAQEEKVKKHSFMKKNWEMIDHNED